MEQMTLLDFMTWFLGKQTKGWLIREILNSETALRGTEGFLSYWRELAENCQVEIVNEPESWEPPRDWSGDEEE